MKAIIVYPLVADSMRSALSETDNMRRALSEMIFLMKMCLYNFSVFIHREIPEKSLSFMMMNNK